MQNSSEPASLLWLKEAGVDWIAADEPRNFLEVSYNKKPGKYTGLESPTAKFQAAPKTPIKNEALMAKKSQKSPIANNSSLNEAIAAARLLADSARNLNELRLAIEEFTGCDLKKTADKTVFSDGNAETKLMLIGEAPGADEDIQGIPFCGMSGQVLDKVLNSVGLDRKTGFYITNTVFWRPPGNRKPSPEELAICAPFLEKHIALVAPKMLVLVGATAVQAILQDNSPMTKMRGKFYDYQNIYMQTPTKVMVTYHPSYLMRAGMNKRLAWEDMLTLQDFLAAN
jgi:DNA polymerase